MAKGEWRTGASFLFLALAAVPVKFDFPMWHKLSLGGYASSCFCLRFRDSCFIFCIASGLSFAISGLGHGSKDHYHRDQKMSAMLEQ
jgi:hypothetical protein